MDTIDESIYCRVCLRTDSKVRRKCISLFVKHNDFKTSDIINSIADIKIQQGDGLPSKICPDCLSELDIVVGFKTKCESSNILLRNTLFCDQKPSVALNSRVKSSDQIKKEEHEVPEEYWEAEFLDDHSEYPIEDICHEVKLDNNLEIKADDETIVKKSRAIDLKLECNECGGFFKSKCKMRVHWKKVHLTESLICPICKRTFKSYKAFNRHKINKTQACSVATKIHVEGIGRSRVFHCKKCSYTSRRAKDIQSHIVVHTGERPFVCDICSKGFSQQSSLQAHRETRHKIYLLETTCMYCGKHMKGRDRIYKHMKTHTSQYVQCDICNKKLKDKRILINHLKRHSGVRSYTCDQCAKTFYVMSELCNHRRTIHEKGKYIYKCDICDYKAFTSKTIKSHKARHTSTNLPCLECGMFFENAQKLTEHQKRHFGERKYACPHCEKRFMNRKSLSQHVREVHKCTFLLNKPIIKQEATESLCSSLNQYCPGNIIEVEIPPP